RSKRYANQTEQILPAQWEMTLRRALSDVDRFKSLVQIAVESTPVFHQGRMHVLSGLAAVLESQSSDSAFFSKLKDLLSQPSLFDELNSYSTSTGKAGLYCRLQKLAVLHAGL